jgi:hypothetical protein
MMASGVVPTPQTEKTGSPIDERSGGAPQNQPTPRS